MLGDGGGCHHRRRRRRHHPHHLFLLLLPPSPLSLSPVQYLDLCLVSETLHWLTPLALGTSCCFLRELSDFSVPWEPDAYSQIEQHSGIGCDRK